MSKIKNYVTVFIMASFFMILVLWNVLGEKADYSESERRVLAKLPEVTAEYVLSGKFATEFEDYAVDAFPMRDAWRRVKAYVRTGLFAQKDNNGIYTADGHIAKLEYPMNTQMLEHALGIFAKVHDKYLKDNKVYFAVVPDKNRYLAQKNGYPSLDYDKFTAYVKQGTDYAEYIEIADLLSAEDYYSTDTHWKQEALPDVAERIAEAMGTKLSKDYKTEKLDLPFEGVYVGQSALVCQPDTISYLTNQVIEQVTVEGAKAVYDMDKAKGKDAYEMFLSGNQPIITMRDAENTSGKRLIVFRDSFGSSIAPLLMSGYSEIVLVDLRYVSSDMLGLYVDFLDADVLFLYSTLMLNNSLGIK